MYFRRSSLVIASKLDTNCDLRERQEGVLRDTPESHWSSIGNSIECLSATFVSENPLALNDLPSLLGLDPPPASRFYSVASMPAVNS